jgi:hypothetical protein
MSLGAEEIELRESPELAVGRIMAEKELGCETGIATVLKSVARIRIVKTEF